MDRNQEILKRKSLNKLQDFKEEQKQFQIVSIQKTILIFLILIVGIIFSLIILIIEIISKNKINSIKKYNRFSNVKICYILKK